MLSQDPLVLDGLGIPCSTASETMQASLADAKSPLGATLLLACHQALVQELSALDANDVAASGFDTDAIPTPESLLELPESHPRNSIVANIHLYLVQLLCYLRHTSFDTSIPRTESANEIGILAFSTGMFAAVVIASSVTVPDFLTHAVEVFRAVFWLGLRVQKSATRATGAAAQSGSLLSSWSLVIFGAQRSEVQQAVDRYNADRVGHSLNAHDFLLIEMTTERCRGVSCVPHRDNPYHLHISIGTPHCSCQF